MGVIPKKKSYLCIKRPYRVVLIANEAFCPDTDRGLLLLCVVAKW